MGSLIKVEVNLKQDTLRRIDQFSKFGIIKNEFSKLELPTNNEEFIKAALYFYLQRLDRIKQFISTENLYGLNSRAPLKNVIKQYLKDNGMRQKDLVDLTGIDAGALSHILSNRNQPSMDYFLRIWVALDYPPIEELFYRDTQ